MKYRIFVLLLISSFYVNGQEKPFNCSILNEIFNRIVIEKQNIAIHKLVIGKYCTLVDSKSGEYERKIKDEYKNDKIVDSILKLPNFDDISQTDDDSLFYLKKWNVIIDTFNFFSLQCSFVKDGINIIIVNSYNKIPCKKDLNLLTVYSIGNHKGFSTISFKHSSTKEEWDLVMFLYFIERNKPFIKELEVVRQSMY